jgi:hypothetical protein
MPSGAGGRAFFNKLYVPALLASCVPTAIAHLQRLWFFESGRIVERRRLTQPLETQPTPAG